MTTTILAATRATPDWLQVRNGLGGFRTKLSSGPARIAYLGASVTAQREGYRPRLHAWLGERDGHAHDTIAAAIGAMGSAAMVFLADDLVVARSPDLCFIELTTADVAGYSPLSMVGPAVEGLLRKLSAARCRTCIVHLHRWGVDLSPGSPVVRSYEEIADHYGVPSVNLGWHVAREARAGRLRLADHYRDDVHETETGAAWTARRLADALGVLLDTPEESTVLPPPLHRNHSQRTRVVPVDNRMRRAGAPFERGRFRFNYDYVRMLPGDEVEAVDEGTVVGALVVVGPRSGVIEVGTPRAVRRYGLFDQWCHYARLSSVLFDEPAEPGLPMRIAVTDERVDHSLCPRAFAGKGEHVPCLDLVGLLVRDPA